MTGAEIHFEPEPGSTSAMHQITPPKPVLRAALVIVALTFGLVISASQFGVGKSADTYGTPVAQRALVFGDAADGGIVVRDGGTGEVALTLPQGTNGFLRGALRGLADRRRRAGLSPEAPFLLTAWDDGRVTLEDPITKERVAVSSFGRRRYAASWRCSTARGPSSLADRRSLLQIGATRPTTGPTPLLQEARVSLSRREFVGGLSGAAALWLAGALACRDRLEPGTATHALPADSPAPPRVLRFLTADEAKEVEAIAARIIPTDETPGAREAGVVWFIDGALATFFDDAQPMVRPALAAWAGEVARAHPGKRRFSELGEAEQDAFLRAREQSDLFGFLRAGTVFGMFALPKYGGNADYVGWQLIGQDRVFEYQPPFGWYDHPDNQRALLGRVL